MQLVRLLQQTLPKLLSLVPSPRCSVRRVAKLFSCSSSPSSAIRVPPPSLSHSAAGCNCCSAVSLPVQLSPVACCRLPKRPAALPRRHWIGLYHLLVHSVCLLACLLCFSHPLSLCSFEHVLVTHSFCLICRTPQISSSLLSNYIVSNRVSWVKQLRTDLPAVRDE